MTRNVVFKLFCMSLLLSSQYGCEQKTSGAGNVSTAQPSSRYVMNNAGPTRPVQSIEPIASQQYQVSPAVTIEQPMTFMEFVGSPQGLGVRPGERYNIENARLLYQSYLEQFDRTRRLKLEYMHEKRAATEANTSQSQENQRELLHDRIARRDSLIRLVSGSEGSFLRNEDPDSYEAIMLEIRALNSLIQASESSQAADPELYHSMQKLRSEGGNQ